MPVTRALAIEYAKEGIRINSRAPGLLNTPMHKPENHDFRKRPASLCILGNPVMISSPGDRSSERFVVQSRAFLQGNAHCPSVRGKLEAEIIAVDASDTIDL